MAQLIELTVKHNYFGEGKVIKLSQNHIMILFDIGEKEFVYPDAFKEFLSIEDAGITKMINKEIKEKEKRIQNRIEKDKENVQTYVDKESPYSQKSQKVVLPKKKTTTRKKAAVKE